MPKQSEIDRMLVLFYRSNNAHDYTNYVRRADWLDKLPMKGLKELVSVMERVTKDVRDEIDRRIAANEIKYPTEWYKEQAKLRETEPIN